MSLPAESWEFIVLNHKPFLSSEQVIITIRVQGQVDKIPVSPCQGVTMDGSVYSLFLLDLIIPSGDQAFFTAGTFYGLFTDISLEDAAKLVRILPLPALQ